jgi:ABC-type glycerol-3-phosphate transport system substrate-binding protein
LQLGQVNSQLYGVPYMLELQHVIYRSIGNNDNHQWSYDALLTRNQPFVFAAGRNGSLNDVVFLQYMAAGGQLNQERQLVLNENALQTTFDFYESASDAGIIDGFTLNFFAPTDYVRAFVDGEFDAGVFTSTQYLDLYQTEHSLKIAPIPTPSGESAAILNGWVWVVVAQEPRHQQLGLDYILWMLDPVRQAQVAQAVKMLPSRRSAMAEGLTGSTSAEPYIELLDNAMLPITDSEGGALTRTMQEALSSILTLERSATQAINFVLEQQTE